MDLGLPKIIQASRRLAGLFALAFVTACATGEPAAPSVAPPPTIDEIYQQHFEAASNSLDLFRSQPGGEIEQALLIIDGSFGPIIGLTSYRFTDARFGSKSSCCTLEASIREMTAFDDAENGGVSVRTYALNKYFVNISQREFDQISASFRNSAFYAAKSTDKENGPICSDGTTYWLEANFMNKHHSIARHTCDKGFSTEIRAADPLFALAIEKLPMLAERLKRTQTSIENSSMNPASKPASLQ